MSYALVKIFSLLVSSYFIQKNLKIPAHLTIFVVALLLSAIGYPIINSHEISFDLIILVALPVLLATESFKVQYNEIKDYIFDLMWVSLG